jgi:hypothetical protein
MKIQVKSLFLRCFTKYFTASSKIPEWYKPKIFQQYHFGFSLTIYFLEQYIGNGTYQTKDSFTKITFCG